MTNTDGVYIDDVLLSNYFKNLVNMLFKILPIRESEEPSLVVYIESLKAEILGCDGLIKAVNADPMLMSLAAILQFLGDNPSAEPHVFKREVFKAINICNKLKARYAFQDKAVM